jgi:exo-beta-1,3-glucanase (GH17 family)
VRTRPIALLLGAIALCFAVMSSIPRLASPPSGATAANASTLDYPIQLIPDRLTLAGEVATQANTQGHCTAPWLTAVPTGTIILGVDPTSCDPADWDGGSATAEVFLPDVYSPTLVVLELSWPDRDGKGLHSPEKNRAARFFLDGRPLWGKRTTRLSTFADYYAAEHQPILTTIVVTQSITHTLTLSVPPHVAWDLSQIELTAYPYPDKIRGIGYSPYRDCQSPDTDSRPTVENIRADLFRLFHTTNAIRTYAATGINHQIPALANAVGLPVFAGAWIDGAEQDAAEVQALIDLANTTSLKAVIVGNEYYLRHRTAADIDYLLDRILEVKSGINDENLPVTTAEIDNLMFTWESNRATVPLGINPLYRPILDEVDFVLVHIYPFWSKLPIDGAAAFTVARYKAMQALIEDEYPGQNKRVIIGEAGWPSAGAPNGAAVPSSEYQWRYMVEFLSLAEQEGVEYMYFDAFDELWKVEEPGRVGQHWGYSYTDRTAKVNFHGVLLPAERLPDSAESLPFQAYLPYVAGGAGGSGTETWPIYTEWLAEPDRFVPSGRMGDVDDISLFQCDRTDPHAGEMAIRVSFSPTGTLGWGGVYWQHPQDNWGDLPGGHDLTAASRLTFWVRGERGGEVVEFLVGGIGDRDDPYRDTIQPARSTGAIVLADTWQQVEINLAAEDLDRVIGGFAWIASRCHNSEPMTFYLDDVVFDLDPTPRPLPPPTRRPFHVYEDAGSVCNHFVPSGWIGDVNGITFNQGYTADPHRGTTAIRISYTGTEWAGVYWQEPENNWGDLLGGYDLIGADRLTFWARSDTPNTQVKFLIGGIGYPDGTVCGNPSQPYPDSVCPKIEHTETLSPTWSQHTIDLHQYPRNLRGVIGGFGWVVDDPATFYLDDIVYEFD